jgi:hypothetical protein
MHVVRIDVLPTAYLRKRIPPFVNDRDENGITFQVAAGIKYGSVTVDMFTYVPMVKRVANRNPEICAKPSVDHVGERTGHCVRIQHSYVRRMPIVLALFPLLVQHLSGQRQKLMF